jgi:methylaspartate ammonia-lyase
VGGRDVLFRAQAGQQMIAEHVVPALTGRELTTFRDLAPVLDALPVHTAVRYGITQALLAAVAHQRQVTMAEVVRDEYETGVTLAPVPVFTQCGDERYTNVDKMILKEADPPIAAVPATRLTSRRACAPTSRWPVVPTRSWPSRGWAWMRALCSSATKWPGSRRWRGRAP